MIFFVLEQTLNNIYEIDVSLKIENSWLFQKNLDNPFCVLN